MEVIVTEQDGIAIVELAGRMDATTTPEFENATRTLLEAGKQRLLIDMSRLEYISSAGLRGILGLVKALKVCTGKLAFCSLQPMTAEVFRISGFNAMLTVRDSRQEALAALAG
jgi:anti-sigma B factor antagonist